jgi:WD40 repeat protein
VDLYGASNGFYVTSMAWSPDGEAIAIAKHHPGATGVISIYDKAGRTVDDLPGGSELLLSLHWNPSGTLLLGISHSGGDSTVMVWDTEAARPIEPLQVRSAVADAAWTDNHSFLICGNGIVGSSTVQTNRLAPLTTRPDIRQADWSRIEHDPHTSTTIVTADGQPAAVGAIASDGRWHDSVAHQADITALCFQPLANAAGIRNDPTQRRLYATAATDGTVKVWNARRPFECVHTLELGKAEPALAISFTPDGYLVAAASAEKVLFWNADAGGPPKASWNGRAIEGTTNGAHLNGDGDWNGVTNGDVEMRDGDEETIPSLSWDADGGKLAYGAKSQVSV